MKAVYSVLIISILAAVAMAALPAPSLTFLQSGRTVQCPGAGYSYCIGELYKNSNGQFLYAKVLKPRVKWTTSSSYTIQLYGAQSAGAPTSTTTSTLAPPTTTSSSTTSTTSSTTSSTTTTITTPSSTTTTSTTTSSTTTSTTTTVPIGCYDTPPSCPFTDLNDNLTFAFVGSTSTQSSLLTVGREFTPAEYAKVSQEDLLRVTAAGTEAYVFQRLEIPVTNPSTDALVVVRGAGNQNCAYQTKLLAVRPDQTFNTLASDLFGPAMTRHELLIANVSSYVTDGRLTLLLLCDIGFGKGIGIDYFKIVRQI